MGGARNSCYSVLYIAGLLTFLADVIWPPVVIVLVDYVRRVSKPLQREKRKEEKNVPNVRPSIGYLWSSVRYSVRCKNQYYSQLLHLND